MATTTRSTGRIRRGFVLVTVRSRAVSVGVGFLVLIGYAATRTRLRRCSRGSGLLRRPLRWRRSSRSRWLCSVRCRPALRWLRRTMTAVTVGTCAVRSLQGRRQSLLPVVPRPGAALRPALGALLMTRPRPPMILPVQQMTLPERRMVLSASRMTPGRQLVMPRTVPQTRQTTSPGRRSITRDLNGLTQSLLMAFAPGVTPRPSRD